MSLYMYVDAYHQQLCQCLIMVSVVLVYVLIAQSKAYL